MSNDQSQPARKIIPYKKGKSRKSPFADMAFQFSGTALDVAIQQREEGGEEIPNKVPEVPVRELPDDKAVIASPVAPQAEPPQEVKEEVSEMPRHAPALAEQEPSPSPTAVVRPRPRQTRPPARNVRLVVDERSGPAVPEAPDGQLQAFITRWRPFLTETQLAICTYVYNNSAAVGRDSCFTSTAKLMAAVSKTERQVKTVLNQLTDWGFLIKGETVVNAPREQRGTYYHLAVTKS